MSLGIPLAIGGVGINDELPTAVSFLNLENKISNGSVSVSITWGNPTSNFGGTVIVKKEGSAPTKFTDGTIVYDGTGTTYIDENVVIDTQYYYRAYTYNSRRQIQTLSVTKNITPKNVIYISELPNESVIKDFYNTDSSNMYFGINFIKIKGTTVIGQELFDDYPNDSNASLNYDKALNYIKNTIHFESEVNANYITTKRLANMNDTNYKPFNTESGRIKTCNNTVYTYWLNDIYSSSDAYAVDGYGNITHRTKTSSQHYLPAIVYNSFAKVNSTPDKDGYYSVKY